MGLTKTGVRLSFLLAAATLAGFAVIPAISQSLQLQERLADIKQAARANRETLAKYTWQEQQTIIMKNEERGQKLFQVQVGADGKLKKILLRDQLSSSKNRMGGSLRERIFKAEIEEAFNYTQVIAALAQSYMQPETVKLQLADVTLGSVGVPGEIQLIITNYIKPDDSVSLIFDRALKTIESLLVSSYLDKRSDAVLITAQFSTVPDGINHVSQMTVDDAREHLTLQVANSNYKKK
jgi:hypothetical protein